MNSYVIETEGTLTSAQIDRLRQAGVRYQGERGKRGSYGVVKKVYAPLLVEAEDEERAIARVSDAAPELRKVWEKTPPRVISVKGD